MQTRTSYFEVVVWSGYHVLSIMAFAHLRLEGVSRELTPSNARCMLPCGGGAGFLFSFSERDRFLIPPPRTFLPCDLFEVVAPVFLVWTFGSLHHRSYFKYTSFLYTNISIETTLAFLCEAHDGKLRWRWSHPEASVCGMEWLLQRYAQLTPLGVDGSTFRSLHYYLMCSVLYSTRCSERIRTWWCLPGSRHSLLGCWHGNPLYQHGQSIFRPRPWIYAESLRISTSRYEPNPQLS